MAACLVAMVLPAPMAPPARASDAKPGGCQYRDRLPATTNVYKLRAAVACLVNRRRDAHGLRALRIDPELRRAASGHSKSMVRHDYFSHYSRGGTPFDDRIRRSGYLSGARSWTLGEVIAAGQGWRATPRGIVHAWMHSPGHRAEILSPRFRDMGAGVAHGVPGEGRHGATYTIDFGARS